MIAGAPERFPVGNRRAHRPDASHAIAEQDLLRFGERLVDLGRCRLGNGFADELAGGIDKHSVVDLTPVRCRRGGGHARGLHRCAVGDDRMAVDALEHDRPVGDDGVEVGGGREALVGPQLLVPAAALDPLHVRVRCGIVAKPLLQLRQRSTAGDIEPQRVESEVDDVSMGVDQARHQGAAAGVDRRAGFRPRLPGVQDTHDLPVVAHHKSGEMLDVTRRVRLNAVGMDDQCR